MPTFREHCSSLHQGEKQLDTSDTDEVNCNVQNVGIKQWIKTRRQPENLLALLKRIPVEA